MFPVIDLTGADAEGSHAEREVVQKLRDAAMWTGFFYVTGHGIAANVIEEQFAVSRRFFGLPLASKRKLAIGSSASKRGYEALDEQTLDASAHADLKESFECGIEYDVDHPYVARGYQSAIRHLPPPLANRAGRSRRPCLSP